MGLTGLRKSILGAGLTLALATPAGAAWMRAETAHFIVYSNDKEERVHNLATELETFDSVLRRFHATPEEDAAGSNKLTVFVVEDVAAVQRLCGGCPNVAGFYQGRASGSVAFTPRDTYVEGRNDLRARTVLYHEYAHHFLFGNYAYAYPAWFSEGYAEFASTFRQDRDGMTIGAAAQHRALGLFSGTRLSTTALFDPAGRKLSAEQQEVLYGRGWLLTHYVMFNPERGAQFNRYLKQLNSGTPSLAAAKDAFGDLSALDKALDGYLRNRTIKALVMKASTVPVPTVSVRALGAGEAALIDERMTSVRGVSSKTARPLFSKARGIAARYPDDAVVQGWLAEMAYDADDLEAAEAAADRAIASDPKSSQGLLYKGLIGVRRAAKVKADAPGWRAARAYIIRANQLDPNNAQPLLSFYESYAAEGRPPTKNAIAGLMRAQELAPQDAGLRFTAVAQSIHDGDLKRAKQLLQPLAYNPHGGPDSTAAKLYVALDAAKDQKEAEAALAAASGDDAADDKKAPPADAPTDKAPSDKAKAIATRRR